MPPCGLPTVDTALCIGNLRPKSIAYVGDLLCLHSVAVAKAKTTHTSTMHVHTCEQEALDPKLIAVTPIQISFTDDLS